MHGTPFSDNGEFSFINGSNLNNGIISLINTKKCNISEYQKYKKKLSDATILISINGTLGNLAKYNYEKIILGKKFCLYYFIR